VATKIIPIAASFVTDKNRILLVKRKKFPFENLWSLPGGKIERDEHIIDAAIREVLEETGIECSFSSFNGVVSEKITENREAVVRMLITLCELKPKTFNIRESPEGEVRWFSLGGPDNMKDDMVPSDYHMIKNMLLDGGKYKQKEFSKKGS
jgi:ADP-ribose pyrophosphatase YjhB (NUDIX family)